MKKILFFFLVIPVMYFAQQNSLGNNQYFKAYKPNYIPLNSHFKISSILNNSLPNASELEIYLLTDYSINFLEAELKTSESTRKIKFLQSTFANFNGKVFKATINLQDTTIDLTGYFQLVYKLHNNEQKDSHINFSLVYKRNNKELKKYSSLNSENSNKIMNLELYFYKPQKTAGKSILLNKDSNLNFMLKESSKHPNFLFEFFIKFRDYNGDFLHFINKSNLDTLYSVRLNRFQIIYIETSNPVKLTEEKFISENAWYKFLIDVSLSESKINIFIDDRQVASIEKSDLSSLEEYFLNFTNNKINSDIIIDEFKIWKYKNSTNTRNLFQLNDLSSNYDELNQLVYYNFNDPNETNKNTTFDFLELSFQNIKNVESNAPVFSKGPELDVTLYGTYSSLEWFGGDFKNANKYFVERAIGDDKFEAIAEINSINVEDNFYNYNDPTSKNSEVVFYRIKQQNKDGSVVYSSQVKIGQGKIEQFNLAQNYPNPFNPSTTITIDLFEGTFLELTVYDAVGKLVTKMNDGYLNKGTYNFNFDGTELPSGIYFYEVKTPNSIKARKMILAK